VIILGRSGRFAIATAPVATAFLAAEWMVLTGSGSFAGVINNLSAAGFHEVTTSSSPSSRSQPG
jgi:hypothetical protein